MTDSLEVKTPEAWAEADYALADRYTDLVFERDAAGGRTGAVRIVGVGHRLFDQALQRAGQLSGVLAHCARLHSPLLVASVEDEVTGQGSSVMSIGVQTGPTIGVQKGTTWRLGAGLMPGADFALALA